MLAPGLRDVFGDTAGAGAPCSEETNNGHGSTFANKYFEHNTCAYARNRFLVPSKQVHIKCGGSLPLEEWQTKYGQDPGATVEALPPIAVLLEDAQALLRV